MRSAGGSVLGSSRHALTVYALLVFGYLLLPIAVVVAFSFNDPAGRFNYTWQGFTLRTGRTRSACPDCARRCRARSRSRRSSSARRDRRSGR